MSISLIFKTIIGVANAIPMIMKTIDKFYDFYIDKKIENLESSFRLKDKQKKALYEAIKNAKDDDERIALSILLNDIEHNR